MTTSHIDRSQLHRCYITGCMHHGTMSTGTLDHAYCKYHFGASRQNMAAITARVNAEAFKKIHDAALKLSNRSPGHVLVGSIAEWLKKESSEIYAFASSDSPKTSQSAAAWIFEALHAYATHDLLSTGTAAKRSSDPSWSALKSALAQSEALQKLGVGIDDA